MKRLLLPALLLLSSAAWADIPPADGSPMPPKRRPPPAQPENTGRNGCAAAMSLSLTLAALGAGWLIREKRRTA